MPITISQALEASKDLGRSIIQALDSTRGLFNGRTVAAGVVVLGGAALALYLLKCRQHAASTETAPTEIPKGKITRYLTPDTRLKSLYVDPDGDLTTWKYVKVAFGRVYDTGDGSKEIRDIAAYDGHEEETKALEEALRNPTIHEHFLNERNVHNDHFMCIHFSKSPNGEITRLEPKDTEAWIWYEAQSDGEFSIKKIESSRETAAEHIEQLKALAAAFEVPFQQE